MQGIFFTEFLDLVENKFGLAMVDKIITQSDLNTMGVYTRAGNYSFFEMLELLKNLSSNTNISIDALLLTYGEYFFDVLEQGYPTFLNTYKDPIEVWASIENHIHIEVRKIYPDAELPTFTVVQKTKNKLILIYYSNKAMHYFTLGLMNKTFDYFNTKVIITLEKINKEGTEVKFIINRN